MLNKVDPFCWESARSRVTGVDVTLFLAPFMRSSLSRPPGV